jgi:hypothetical protein
MSAKALALKAGFLVLVLVLVAERDSPTPGVRRRSCLALAAILRCPALSSSASRVHPPQLSVYHDVLGVLRHHPLLSIGQDFEHGVFTPIEGIGIRLVGLLLTNVAQSAAD